MFSIVLILEVAFPEPPPLRPSPDEGGKQYVFVINLSRRVALISGEDTLIGRLDQNGNLRIEISHPSKAATSGPTRTLINGLRGEPVYEFRSGRLIKGEIQDDGRFVPNSRSEVIDFGDYKYHPNAIRIYNLPGYFVEEKSSRGGNKR